MLCIRGWFGPRILRLSCSRPAHGRCRGGEHGIRNKHEIITRIKRSRHLTEGATAFRLRVFQTVFGWSKERTKMQMVSLMKDVRNRAFHTYSM